MTLRSLENRTTITSQDPIALSAVVQRIKRACTFAARTAYYDAMFEFQHEEIHDLTSAATPPLNSRPELLIAIPPKIEEYVNKQ